MMLLLQRVWIKLTADRRRFAVLCTLAVLGAVLWGRNALEGQRRTQAGAPPAPLIASGAGAGVADNGAAPEVTVALDLLPRRDPTAISADAFPKPTSPVVMRPEDPKSGGNEAENEHRRRALAALADRFVLEAVMIGRPLAVINGRTYRTRSYVARSELEGKLAYQVPAVGRPEIAFDLVDIVNREDQGNRSYLTYVVLECQGFEFRVYLKH